MPKKTSKSTNQAAVAHHSQKQTLLAILAKPDKQEEVNKNAEHLLDNNISTTQNVDTTINTNTLVITQSVAVGKVNIDESQNNREELGATSLPQKKESHWEQPSNTSTIFQAIGVITGAVKAAFMNLTITINGNEYQLERQPHTRNKKAYDKLFDKIVEEGTQTLSLTVYPKVTLFSKDKPCKISFCLVRLTNVNIIGVGETYQIEDFEFRLCGIWQYPKRCDIPCISIFKNFDKNRNELVKKLSNNQKIAFMKESHIPVIWESPTSLPFQYNPNKQKQASRPFVQIKARFIPEQNLFEFISEYSAPTTNIPEYFRCPVQKNVEPPILKNKTMNIVDTQVEGDSSNV